ncbi:DNA (cytosine-5)-methyltransferase DRM2-like isoform X1 [Asparagus officinalis]|uniref:DNA (cytosine-5)-methyltransferase DRM2-like isoform X1 n=1 Tax=Asparagus officinalis TaxID=4686 RepID=UPI00098DEA8D|nr:DNA (cytosine-5)-methyltransferase DRM2-like isoform X1 [Asparagus officinalis]XP_020255656.1 DNA (cytosine-5)-methyltransferase DRM2-like isoform X1 [Asparagus officinalis]
MVQKLIVKGEMDWSSDGDDNHGSERGTGRTKPVPPLNSAAAPSNEDWGSDSDEIAELDWDVHEAVPSREVSEAGPSHTNWTSHFVAMGFSEELVAEAIKQNREGDNEGILETLLTYGAIGKSHKHEESPGHCSPANDKKDVADGFSEKDKIVSTLVDMGFLAEEASSAIDRCGPNATILELADSIHASQMQEDSGDQLWEGSSVSPSSDNDDDDVDDEDFTYSFHKEKKSSVSESARKSKRIRVYEREKEMMKKLRTNYDENLPPLAIPKPMIGFGLPLQQPRISHRKFPDAAIGPPFFYYENVAPAPRGVWERISRFLYDIEPEFVDSKYFCAASEKRGYIHNLPINNRFPLLPIPPKTIHEAFPATKKWWPSWDTRTHLNCLETCTGKAKHTEKIRLSLSQSDDPPPERVQRYILEECNKGNLVWVGLHKVVPLEPDEIETLLGFPRNHTRGISRTERYKSLGNAFQIDIVAFHLSVLKEMFPDGITVLSIFSGIGGAEVALYRLGIRLKTVVSVEASEINRNVLRSWWDQTNQKGTLIEISDVQQLNGDRLEHLIHTYGGFDLVIGRSPCVNVTGSDQYSRDGLHGKHSAMFYDYFRILDLVKCIMEKN